LLSKQQNNILKLKIKVAISAVFTSNHGTKRQAFVVRTNVLPERSVNSVHVFFSERLVSRPDKTEVNIVFVMVYFQLNTPGFWVITVTKVPFETHDERI
jgi:hypothetical protein